MTSFSDRFSEYTRTLDCVHCGLCLPHCPTYSVTLREADSPRGRIHLMRGHAEGRFELTDEARHHLDLCIVCRGCESVCPSGIRMGEMMEAFREEQPRTRLPLPARLVMRHVIPNRQRVAALTSALAWYDRTGLPKAVDGLLGRIAPAAARAHAMRPEIPAERGIEAGRTWPARGPRRATVALFLGCVAAEWFAPVHRATIRVLTANGCDVVVPESQTCCGALHRHAGLMEDAAELLAANARAFPADVDAVIVNAAGCGASLLEPLDESLPLPPYRDVCEFLHELGWVAETRPVRRRVAYDQPCHLVHDQRVGPEGVTALLGRIPEVTLVPLPGSERCCGAGGVYNLRHGEMADEVLAAKVEAIEASGADTVVTGNPGCLMQIRQGLRGRGVDVLHPIEVLDEGTA